MVCYIALRLCNPLVESKEFYSIDPNVKIYKQSFTESYYFVKKRSTDGELDWYCFDSSRKSVTLPNFPKTLLGYHFYNFDMHHGVPLTFEVKVSNGVVNWGDDYFEFSYGKKEAVRIERRILCAF